MSWKPLTDKEAEQIARVLIWLWPEPWRRTGKGVWRCIVATKCLVLGTLAVLLLLLAYLVYLEVR